MVNPLAAALGPVGGLAACACCLLIAAIWGLFATTIALAVYTSKSSLSLFLSSFPQTNLSSCHSLGRWRNAIRDAGGISSSAVEILSSHALLIGILCLYGYVGLRRALRSAA